MNIDASLTGARNATLADLAGLLRDQQARKADIVAPAAAIRARDGRLVIDDSAPELGPDGVTMTAGSYLPTEVQGVVLKELRWLFRDQRLPDYGVDAQVEILDADERIDGLPARPPR